SCHPNHLLCWDLGTGKLLRRFETWQDPRPQSVAPPPPGVKGIIPSRLPHCLRGMTLSSRAEWLAAVEHLSLVPSDETRISILNPTTGNREPYFGSRKDAGRSVAFFPVGRSLADVVCTKKSSFIEVWEPLMGKSRRRLPEVSESLVAVAISPDGK